ncbi:MAG: hypothetical protein R8M11_06870 [Gallionella sp.]
MNKPPSSMRHTFISISLMILACVAGLFFWQSHVGFSLMDEGFLWYGAQRVMVGEVPIRDFMAYDIGRYYWSAAIMSLLGDNGIVALRISAAVFQALALFIGVATLARNQTHKSLLYWLLALVTLMVWMAEQFRIFDIAIPIMLVGALSYLIEKPTCRRYLLVGLAVGIAATFGRNHGVYGVAGSLCALIYLTTKHGGSGPNLFAAFRSWASGVTVGYLPVLVFILFVPGFAQAFWESIIFLFESGTTNLPLPIPWPWLTPFGKASFFQSTNIFLTGILFIAIIAFGILGIGWLIKNIRDNNSSHPTFVASVFLALPYAHYAFSRADITHLAPGIPPFLIGILALLADQPAKIRWPLATILFAVSLWVMLPIYPSWRCNYIEQCKETWVANDKLYIKSNTANNLLAINKLTETFAADGGTFIAAPFWPGAYAATGRKSPVWENYMLLPRSEGFQLAEIERIKAAKPEFVLINNSALDNREELRFSNSRPIIAQYIHNNFIPVSGYATNSVFQLYRSQK